jgi:hypothetical protein
MKNLIAASVFAATSLFSQLAAAAPVTLFDSLPTQGLSTFNAQMVGTPNSYTTPFRVFDAFTLGQAATISTADFVVYDYGNGLPSMANLGIFSVADGKAGTELFSQQLTASQMGSVADANVWGNLVRISVAPTALTLDAGSYFISLAGTGYDAFAIATFSKTDSANPVNAAAYTYQTLTDDATGVAAYRLIGSTGAATAADVPEPSVLALFALGAAGAFAARRRKAASQA